QSRSACGELCGCFQGGGLKAKAVAGCDAGIKDTLIGFAKAVVLVARTGKDGRDAVSRFTGSAGKVRNSLAALDHFQRLELCAQALELRQGGIEVTLIGFRQSVAVVAGAVKQRLSAVSGG